MASYVLKSSFTTVQVLSPGIVNEVVYCTIETSPSSIIASIPVQADEFAAGTTGPLLTALADGIETIVGRGHIIAGQGAQTLDANGLLSDYVAFVVEYVPPNTSGTSITAEALVPVGLLSQSDVTISETLLAEAEAIVQGVYDHLKNAATG